MPVFVFGSNMAGRHGKGAALFAKEKCGAIYGRGVGRQGNSYAIPTKDANIKTLPLGVIAVYVQEFIEYARLHGGTDFQVTAIGCGLAGYKPEQIAPMFKGVGPNVHLPPEFASILTTEGPT